MLIRESIKKYLKSIGIIVKRYPETDIVRRMKLVNSKQIDLLIDVGANTGQYSCLMRDYGYKGRIISFEPLIDAYNKLIQLKENDPLWDAFNFALGDKHEKSFINISGNSYSSSILDMLDTHLDSAPESKYIARQEILIKKLDEIFTDISNESSNIMLKMDVQGFEKEVLDGAKNCINQVDIIQLEMSIKPLYKDELILCEMINYLDKLNFELFSLENGYFDSDTGQLLQVDGIFSRKQ
jgi:FkbM family methyltransferase